MTVSRQREWQLANPEKAATQSQTYRAIRSGRLIRPDTCSQCSNVFPQAHHEDYSKPLEVTWLCKDCHAALHAEKRLPARMARHDAKRRARREAAAVRHAQRRTVEYIEALGTKLSSIQTVYEDGALLEALRGLADESGHLSCQQYRLSYQARIGTSDPLPSPAMFEIRFGSWRDAIRLAGLSCGTGRHSYSRTPDDRLVEGIRVAIEVIGHLPSVAEYNALRDARPDLGLRSRSLISRRIPTWGEALRRATEHEPTEAAA